VFAYHAGPILKVENRGEVGRGETRPRMPGKGALACIEKKGVVRVMGRATSLT
jgi:hypothetical protein